MLLITKRTMIAIMAIFGAIALLSYYLDTKAPVVTSGLPVQQLVIEKASGGSHSFTVEIAEKPVDIQVGLMYRETMPKDHGMLFILGKEPRDISFWMKNTVIPLDMLFVERDGRIAKVHPMAQPRSLTGIPSETPVLAVIELNGGRAAELGIKSGDKVIHPYFQ